jgi:hypothetical protein
MSNRWYPHYEVHRRVELDNSITLALAVEMRNAILDSYRRPGLYPRSVGYMVTPLEKALGRIQRRAS